MALFVVEHAHSADTCPAGHPQMGPMLVQHVTNTNASRFGVRILGDAVVNGAHRFVLIVEAQEEPPVKDFMAPFYQVGTVQILPASSCEAVVARAKC
ncbi:MAG: sulfite oxidase [Chloroflexi bacterium]|nr:sulfite oxidase [Chloroflexota bacterium]